MEFGSFLTYKNDEHNFSAVRRTNKTFGDPEGQIVMDIGGDIC